MILFFYGQDNYRLRKKVKALKERFISASLGDTNLAILSAEKLTYDQFIRQILAMPFLAKTRLLIVENIMQQGKKDILEKIPDSLAKVPSSTVLVFVEEGNPDKRTSLFKKLSKEKSEEFKLLEPEPLRRWIIREIEIRNGKWESAAVSKLIEYIGNDLWRQSNELDKLIAYRQSHIAREDIELLVKPQVEANIFNLIDNIAAKNLKGAMRELYKLLDSGQHELYILTMIVWQYRNLLIVKDLSARTKITNSWALAKKAALSPFVVQKCLGISSRYSLEELKEIYRTLLDFDIEIKTGKIEPRTAIELLIFKLTSAENPKF